MPDELDRVFSSMIEVVEPDEVERAAIEAATAELIDRTEAAIDRLGYDADVLHVGSTARDTWLSGERDIDVFVRFPPTLEREMLRERGLAVGFEVLPDGTANYAEHPYVCGSLNGFDVDIVPCYRVDTAGAAKTAVDRTPFHTAYVREHLEDDVTTEVRLAKRFLNANALYGSDLRTRAFGGYLVELLVLEFGSFRDVLTAVADWQPPICIDLEDHSTRTFSDPLVVVDPTDPTRNVASVVTSESIARFQHYARRLLADPDTALFDLPEVPTLDEAQLEAELTRRGTDVFAVVIEHDAMLDDQLYPQLRKTRNGLVDGLEAREFAVFRSDLFASETEAVVLLECRVSELPSVERHEGPPVWIRDHAERFVDTYEKADVYGPFIEGDRYVIERERALTHAREFLDSEAVFEVGLGEHLERSMAEQGYHVLANGQLCELLEDFRAELAAYFDPAV